MFYQLTNSGFLSISDQVAERGGKQGVANHAMVLVEAGLVSVVPTFDTPPDIIEMEGWDEACWEDDRLSEDYGLESYLDGEIKEYAEDEECPWRDIASWLTAQITREHKR